jgi:hypothetical protein
LSSTDHTLDKAVAPAGGWAAMSTPEADKVQQLQDAGVIIREDLPPEYASVAQGLTKDELDVLVSVKTRLDEAQRSSGIEIGEVFFAP